MVLVLIEAMRDSSTFDKEAARNMLNTVKRNCDFWLVDVSGLWLDCPLALSGLVPPSIRLFLSNPGVSEQ